MAAPTDSAVLECGSTEYEVTGFGRGQVLQVVDNNDVFVVTFAQLSESGRIVFNNPGLSDGGDIVTCTTTTPLGTDFLFQGFFTPRG